MFVDELTPIFKELTRQPMAFLGGLVSGVFRLNLADDPVKSWLDQQAGTSTHTTFNHETPNGRNNGPQSISID
ncbi:MULTISPECIES: hypothetical protein [Trichocoleus]|uniref:Uncharacterized protein n=1 Tax=Trichocoleus desertorum GB2-A4 TaxID=2933944 RepID=A0ABV0J6I9_9CYAN|nr:MULTISPECIES: hypothetical protein [unclassified Trichocoleus]MBD1863513.1 hypothetical protein [Trichocoleus sp. FACHB-46]MBD2099116.1 hypothetical protein [Trichocoleus sp. FACHB-591]MBD2123887.1 hypothetical protein [Trichocoleus sp. FACHB-262]